MNPNPMTDAVSRADSVNQSRVFRQLRSKQTWNGLQILWDTGRIKFITMASTSVLVAGFVFALSWYAFKELFAYNVPFKGLIVGGLFDLLFFTLGTMLVVSTGIIVYASLFTAPEARFLLTTPARADQIFATKFIAAIGFSSWAFVVLGVPILLAYGIAARVSWYFYPLIPAFLLGFVLLPGSVSSLVALVLVRVLPRNRKLATTVMVVVACVAAIAWGIRAAGSFRNTISDTTNKNAVEGLVGQFALARHPLVPSHWMTTGLMAAAREEPLTALVSLAMIWSNGLILFALATWVAKKIYRTAYDGHAGGGSQTKIYRTHWLDRLMGLLVFYLDRPTRILIVKDFRTFRRDPTQWVLLVIFGGLILVGGLQLRNISQSDLPTLDKYAVSLANLGATSVLLCAGLSRFIFPMISLEGRKFWVLGLLPIKRDQILAGKFVFAATVSVLSAVGLLVFGDVLLGLPWEVVLCHTITAGLIALGLSGLNVGLGAYLPNFRETDPSKIVVGFGGTVNMVVGLGYLVLILALTMGPLHGAAVASKFRTGQDGLALPWWAFAGIPVAMVAAMAAVVLPLRAGSRALNKVEF